MNTRVAVTIWLACALFLFCSGPFLDDGVSLGVMGMAAFVALSLFALMLIEKKVQADLPAIFLTAVSLRWVVATVVHYAVYPSRPGLFAPDEIHYDLNGWWYALYLHDKAPNPYMNAWAPGIVQLAGGIYYLFGHVPLVAKMFIGVLGAWCAPLTALITYRMFPRVARSAGYWAALFPSLVLWSSLLIKDTTTLLGVELSLAAFLYLKDNLNIWLMAVFLLGLALIGADRPYEMVFVVLGAMGSFLVTADSKRLFRSGGMFLAFALLVVLVMKTVWVAPVAFEQAEKRSVLEEVTAIRTGYAEGTGSALPYDIVDTTSPAGLILWMPIGLFFFFFAPIPFTGTSVISIATSPEMLLLYFLIPSLWRGLRYAIKKKANGLMTLLFYTLSSSVGWSMLVTNVGTLYRYRAQVMFFPLLLIAIDRARKRGLIEPAEEEQEAQALAVGFSS